MNSVSSDKISKFLGKTSWILSPKYSAIACFSGWLVLIPFSSSVLGMAMCWCGVYLFITCLRIERQWISVIPFPPLTALVLGINLRWVIGGIILLLNPAEIDSNYYVITKFITDALILHAILVTCLVCTSVINRDIISRKGIEFNAPKSAFRKRYLIVCLVTGFVALGYIGVSYFSGALDRGAEYLNWAGKVWRPDTLFVAVTRLRDIYFLILPLVIQKWRHQLKIVLPLTLTTVLLLAVTASSGGRGLLLWPVLLIISGVWMTNLNVRTFRFILTIFAVFAVSFSSIMGIARNHFEESKIISLDRAVKIVNAAKEFNFDLINPEVGFSYYGHMDPHLFNDYSQSQPRVGFSGLQNLAYVLIPRALMPTKPELNDGHLIANEIRNLPEAGLYRGRYVSFENVTFEGDLYRRFGWPGVIMGSILFGVFFNLFCRLWYLNADLNSNIAVILLTLMPSTFLQGVPLRSVSETGWNWLYEMPKYAIVFLMIGIIFDFILPRITAKKGKT